MDVKYWEEYYTNTKNLDMSPPSLFAQWLKNNLEKHLVHTIIDVGCGTGRDTYYLSHPREGWPVKQVVGLDCAVQPQNLGNATFIKDDVKNISGTYDLLYSRFSLHSIPVEAEDELLEYALKNCRYVAIECRTKNDNLNDGTDRVETSYAKAHYRRFIDSDELTTKMVKMGFSILYVSESNEFAPFGEQRPSCLRIVASI